MKREKNFYFLLMLIFVLSFLLIAIYAFLQPAYRNQPTMPEMRSMAMMMLFQYARMQEYSWRPLLEVCDPFCEEMMGMAHTMPQHGNPVLDTANYVFSLVLIVFCAGLIGAVSVLILLWIPKFKGGEKAPMWTRGLAYIEIFTGLLLLALVFAWLEAAIAQDPVAIQMDLNFWIYSFATLLILLILVVVVIIAFSQGYQNVKSRLSRFKANNKKKQGGKSK